MPIEPVQTKRVETIYYLPGHGGLIRTGLGQELLDRGYDVTGRGRARVAQGVCE